MPLTPAVVALNAYIDDTIDTTSEKNITAGASFIRFYATVQDVLLSWGTDDASTTNFDEVIPAGAVVDLVIPKQPDTKNRFTAFNVISRAAGGGILVIEK